MAIRMMVHCRKCNREFDWNNDEGYAKLPDGSYLCSISCDLKETLDKLALALAAIEAAKEFIEAAYGTEKKLLAHGQWLMALAAWEQSK